MSHSANCPQADKYGVPRIGCLLVDVLADSFAMSPLPTQADKYGVPRICFVNKMDRLGANFYNCVDMVGAGDEDYKIIIH